MTMQYIRDRYQVPAKRGRRIRFDHYQQDGVIVGSDGQYLLVRFDGEKRTQRLHPTWEVTYLETAA